MKDTYRLGQIIKTDTEQKMKRMVSEDIEILPKGSKLLVTRTGFKVLNGECKDLIVPLNGKTIKGTDYTNIARMIYSRLNSVYGLKMYLDDEEIEMDELLGEIEDVLMDIL